SPATSSLSNRSRSAGDIRGPGLPLGFATASEVAGSGWGATSSRATSRSRRWLKGAICFREEADVALRRDKISGGYEHPRVFQIRRRDERTTSNALPVDCHHLVSATPIRNESIARCPDLCHAL